MDTPGQSKKKRDPQKNRVSQRRYRERQKAAFNGIEEVRARNCQRDYVRTAHLKATGQYGAFKAKKAKDRRYYAMSEEQCNEVKRKNLIFQNAWRNTGDGSMRDGDNKWRRKNELWASKSGGHCSEQNMSDVPSQSDAKGVTGWTSIWPVPFLYRGCHWTGQSRSLRRRRRTRCKPFVRTR